ncbi:MAG: tetratricopeptide repeat protein, partial [Prochloraceae cyanobacterium]|nr:tetratricopeptide repeat protein [Prochloraceae cyanobacterium]
MAYYNRGLLYFNQNQLKLALSDYNRSIQINPNLAEPYENRAKVWIKLKNFAKAIRDLNAAITIFGQQKNVAGYQQVRRMLKSVKKSIH